MFVGVFGNESPAKRRAKDKYSRLELREEKKKKYKARRKPDDSNWERSFPEKYSEK